MYLLFIYIYSFLKFYSYGQLAAIYSDIQRSNDCASWSSWGNCIWPSQENKNSYLEQLSPLCQNHWFFRFIGNRYSSALNSFFEYFKSLILDNNNPCGMCSYQQSCGFGGEKKCHTSPFHIQGGRPVIPFYVSERICNKKSLKGLDQNKSCRLDYKQLINIEGDECKIWPTNRVDLSSIESGFREQIQNLKWYNCLAITEINKNESNKVCRCCCFPFQPNPQTFICEHIPGTPYAPEQEKEEENNNFYLTDFN